jgi:hypothetical protein
MRSRRYATRSQMSVDDQDGGASVLFPLGQEGLAGLDGQAGAEVGRGHPEGVDDLLVDAADPDHGVGDVDDGVSRRVEGVRAGADRDGLAGADLAGDHTYRSFGDAPGDAADGLVVGIVSVQHARRQVAAERHALEPVVGLQFLNHGDPSGSSRRCSASSSNPAVSQSTAVSKPKWSASAASGHSENAQ